jgi:hypothetical protein
MEPYREYNGYDYTELHRAFNIPEEINGDDNAEVLQEYLRAVFRRSHVYWGGKSYVMKRTALEIRTFLKRLAKDAHKWNYEAPLWEGLLKIKNDEVMLGRFIPLCPSAWT